MAKIFSGAARVGGARILDPLARGLLRMGVSPDAVTMLGTAGVVAAAIGFGARGQFVIGSLLVAVLALVDMVDGAMARARGYSTRFGALLDSTMDRLADGAIVGAVVYWYATNGETWPMVAALIVLVAGPTVSYVKARALSVGIACDVGLAERGERLAIVGVGAFLTGLGLGWALPAALWLVAILSLVTVAQRVWHVRREDQRSRAQAAAGEEQK